MKYGSALFSLGCFGLAFGATLTWKSLPSPSTSQATISSASAVGNIAAAPPSSPVAIASIAPKTAPVTALPYEKQDEERLLARCRELVATDPEASFRAGMACWGSSAWKEMTEAAKALVHSDPAAARRLLADCPDLRSKSLLESELMADEVSRDPKEKLLWADANLTGYVKIKALNAGLQALAATDAAAALKIVAEWPPGFIKLNGQINGLGYRMKEDPAAAMAWSAENLSPSERGFVGLIASMRYFKDNPGEGLALLPQLPLEYQEHLGIAVANASKRDTSQSLLQMLDTIRSMPGEIQTSVIRSMAWDFQNGPVGEEKTATRFLEALTAPNQRAAVIEVMAVARLSYFHASKEPSKILDSLSQFQTPEDKQAAARVVPYLTDLTETQRGEIMARLK